MTSDDDELSPLQMVQNWVSLLAPAIRMHVLSTQKFETTNNEDYKVCFSSSKSWSRYLKQHLGTRCHTCQDTERRIGNI
jgi:hypothetical protein